MGVSVVGVYEYLADRFRLFCKDNFDEFSRLVEGADLVIGFNNKGFDDPLVKAALGVAVAEEKSYDLLQEVWLAAGLPGHFAGPKSGGYGLEACALANGLPKKTGHGALAPILWQRGETGKVADYCLHDVWLTRGLVNWVRARGTLLCPKTGTDLNVRRPW